MSARRFLLFALPVAIILSGASRATADPVVLVNTFGPSPGYSTESWWGTSDQNTVFMGFQDR